MEMIRQDATIEQIVREVVEFLSQYIEVEMLILYGSYAYGEPREDSDFDIAVISPDLEEMNILDKIELFSEVALAVDCRVELKGFGKSEFQNPDKGSFLEMLKKKGQVVYPA